MRLWFTACLHAPIENVCHSPIQLVAFLKQLVQLHSKGKVTCGKGNLAPRDTASPTLTSLSPITDRKVVCAKLAVALVWSSTAITALRGG